MRVATQQPVAKKQTLAVREAEAEKPVVYTDYNGHEVSLSKYIINNYLSPGANFTEAECWSLIGMAQARGLNPVVKDVYFVKYQGTPQIIVSRDYYEKRANMNANYRGKENGIVVLNRKGEIEYRKGTIMLKDEELLGGWCKVYMANLEHPVFTSVQFEEAVKTKDGSPTATWASMPKTMIEKVAVVRALRSAMTEEFGNTYAADELGFDENELATEVQNVPAEEEPVAKEEPEPQPTPSKSVPKKTKAKQEPVEAEYVDVDDSTGEVMEDEDFDSMQKAFFGDNF